MAQMKNTSILKTCRKVSDVIHQQIELDQFCVAIIDTPQYQRLRSLKQLGLVSLVYPCADHSRFEHCLGVQHLAGIKITHLAQKQPELQISDIDILCVRIGGLIHDLGHGVFSHTYECLLTAIYSGKLPITHEEISIQMFHYPLEKNPKVKTLLDEILTPSDYKFIEEMINHPSKCFDESGNWILEGRPVEKSYLYDIISNKKHGQDLDKFDYFLRDAHYANVTIQFDYSKLNRIMGTARVLNDEQGHPHICFDKKVERDIRYTMESRVTLHEEVYQHKTAIVYDYMMRQVLLLADDHLQFKGDDGKKYKMSEAWQNMGAFEQLVDVHIIQLIKNSDNPALEPAQKILKNIFSRNHYKNVGSIELNDNLTFNEERKKLISLLEMNAFQENDYLILKANIHCGMGLDSHPSKNVLYYDKHSQRGPFHKLSRRIFVGGHLTLHLYSKNPERTAELQNLFLDFELECEKRYFDKYPLENNITQVGPNAA